MILYTKSDCPLCKVIKIKLKTTGIDFTECMDEEKMDELGIDALPVLQLKTGKLLGFSEIIEFIEEVANL